MNQFVPFLTIIAALLDESKPFPAHYLHRFSDLEPVDLNIISESWSQVSIHRKITLLEDLEDLSEADTMTSFDSLARSRLSDPNGQIRIRAIRLLWDCEDARLVPVFLNILNNDEDIEVQAAVANALGQFVYLGELDKIPVETHHNIEDQLLEVVSSDKANLLRRRALESLGYSGRSEVVPLIEDAFRKNDRDWTVSALFAMGRSCDDHWIPQIISQLRSPLEDLRSEAIHATGELEIKSARPILLDLLEDEEDLDIRHELIWALSRIGGEGVRLKLEELQELEEIDEEVDFIEEALDALSSTEEMGGFSIFDIDPDVEFIEEETGEEK
jgi:HEAT repeat protein